MSEYPILIEHFAGKQSLTIVCESCHTEAVITADEIRNECNYICPRACGGFATYKYEEGCACRNCGKLQVGSWPEVLGRCCSRVCQLQHEYAQKLEARKDAA